MSTDIQHIRIGLTNNHPCSYLPERQERVAVALDERLHTEENYQLLMLTVFVVAEIPYINRIASIAPLASQFESRFQTLDYQKVRRGSLIKHSLYAGK